jgi:hypothetical protein
MCEIDLSEYQSDGTYQKPAQIQLQYRSNDIILLNELTCEFNRGHHVAALGIYLLSDLSSLVQKLMCNSQVSGPNASVEFLMDMHYTALSSTVILKVLPSRTSIWPNMSSV